MGKLLFVHQDDRLFWTHRRPVAVAAREAGFEVHVAGPDTGFSGRLRGMGLAVHSMAVGRTVRPDRARRARAELADLVEDLRPAVAQVQTLRATATLGPVLARAGVPTAYLISGLGLTWQAGGLWLRRRLGSLFSAPSWGQFQNTKDRDAFVSAGLVARARTSLFPGSGVDLQEFQSGPEAKTLPRILFASRMLRSKGVSRLVQSSRRLRVAGVAHELILAGEPDGARPGSVSRRRLESWGREEGIRWLGWQENVAQLLAEAHILALPTRYGEGLPRILLEAAACGRPVLASDVAGCRAAVVPGHTGILIPSKDGPALDHALRLLIENPELRQRMGAAARRHVAKHFDARVVARATVEDFRALAVG